MEELTNTTGTGTDTSLQQGKTITIIRKGSWKEEHTQGEVGRAPDAEQISTSSLGVTYFPFLAELPSQVAASQPSSCISTWADKKRSGWQKVILGDIPDPCPGHEVILILLLLSHRLLPLLDTWQEQETPQANVTSVPTALQQGDVPGNGPASTSHPAPAQLWCSVLVKGD